jgi:DNA-directed RNA polymerase specialized sigma subunit
MRKNNYVNNKQLYVVMVEYSNNRTKCQQEDLPKPRVPDYVGRCLMLIATRLASKPSFAGYSYKDDMICDGIANCIEYIDNFDPTKSNNPFAYFTQIIKFAFLRRIEREKKQQYIKIKNLDNYDLHGESDIHDYGKVHNNEIADAFVTAFEKRLTDKKKPGKVGNTVNGFFQ